MQLELEEAEAGEEFLRDLHRRVGWQVAAAYGMPLPEADVAVAAEPQVEPAVDPEVAAAPKLVVVPLPACEPESTVEPVANATCPLPTVAELDRMIAARREADPMRAADWRWSLQHLREFADDEGRLPEDFRATVEVVFGELLATRV